MARIFISYRRADSAAESGRIYDRLTAVFGDDHVFKDVYDIPAGEDFRKILADEVSRCDVLLVVVGPQWATITDADGRKRLHEPDDFVNIEVEAGLSRADVLVIPLLIGNTAMPAPELLPENLRPLCYRNGMPVRNDPDFNRDMQQLIERIRAYSQKKYAPARDPKLAYVGAVAAAAVVIAFGALLFANRTDPAALLAETVIPTADSPTLSQTAVPLNVPVLIAQSVAITQANARVWSLPNVRESEIVTDLQPGTQIVVLDGPVNGPILLDGDTDDDWYHVRLRDESIPIGWLWKQRLVFDDAVQLIERGPEQLVFSRVLSNISPWLAGTDVMLAQGRLRVLNYPTGDIDGYYGPITAEAVRLFQLRNVLPANSSINATTWERLFSVEAIPYG